MTRLEFGVTITMPQNVIFALPPDSVTRVTQPQFGANTFDTSNDPTFATFFQTGGTQFDVARAFIRCNAGNALVTIVHAG